MCRLQGRTTGHVRIPVAPARADPPERSDGNGSTRGIAGGRWLGGGTRIGPHTIRHDTGRVMGVLDARTAGGAVVLPHRGVVDRRRFGSPRRLRRGWRLLAGAGVVA